MKPDLRDSFMYKDRKITADWYDIQTKDQLPAVPWSQVYVVGDLDGAVPIVVYRNEVDSLPGGTPEQGETIDQALRREIREELNCRVLMWLPLGYQKNTQEGQKEMYQLRVYAILEMIGIFESDPGGDVIGYRRISPDSLSETLKWGKIGDRIQRLALNVIGT